MENALGIWLDENFNNFLKNVFSQKFAKTCSKYSESLKSLFDGQISSSFPLQKLNFVVEFQNFDLYFFNMSEESGFMKNFFVQKNI